VEDVKVDGLQIQYKESIVIRSTVELSSVLDLTISLCGPPPLLVLNAKFATGYRMILPAKFIDAYPQAGRMSHFRAAQPSLRVKVFCNCETVGLCRQMS
jgi:hypothetical protein